MNTSSWISCTKILPAPQTPPRTYSKWVFDDEDLMHIASMAQILGDTDGLKRKLLMVGHEREVGHRGGGTTSTILQRNSRGLSQQQTLKTSSPTAF